MRANFHDALGVNMGQGCRYGWRFGAGELLDLDDSFIVE